ncbi:SLC13 family permease [Ornithinibacillus halotolerans]|uniref:SLC13 family permease n=1 Tax=Ornithinibacillus halotolerans TaxID=1274357 RepID=A0A916W766_9BACI|nr:SLC13 family permease [Ornithinibacillus halotolerans]
MQLIGTFIILLVTIILFISNRIRVDLVAIMALLAFVIFGILEPAEALAGFSNSVVIMIAGLFVVGAGILRTGLAQMAGNLLLKWSGDSERKLFFLLLTIVAGVGAFMSNTGTVALMLPVVVSIAISIKESPSKYLIPLAYIGSLSGLLTLIASPPNLIVSQTMEDYGLGKLGFFQITPIGVIAIVVAIIYLFLVRNTVIPKNKSKGNSSETSQISTKQLAEDYHLGGNLFRVKVENDSKIVESPLADLRTPKQYQVFVLKIERHASEGLRILPITYQEMAGPNSIIHAGDVLFVQGSAEKVSQFANDNGLTIIKEKSEANHLVTKELGMVEVLLTPHSSFINKNIASIGFREKYNLNVIGINRKGNYVLSDMLMQPLRFGDALLVQGSWEDIELLSKETQDVVVVGQPKEYASKASANGKAPIAGAIMLLMVVLMIFEVFPAVVSVLIGAVLMIITGCLRNMDDAYSEMNFESIVLIAAMLPMATALEKTGGMELISTGIIDLLGGFGAMGVLIGVYWLTIIFGQVISNTATAVLFAPIALNAALAIDANPYTFAMMVTAASAMAFLTPFSSPTNALVMTAGGYKFFDFVKVGMPLQIIMFIVMIIVIPILYPL